MSLAVGWLRLLQFHQDGTIVPIRDYTPLLDRTADRERLSVRTIPY